jgi:hypothetical protein
MRARRHFHRQTQLLATDGSPVCASALRVLENWHEGVMQAEGQTRIASRHLFTQIVEFSDAIIFSCARNSTNQIWQ